MAHFRHLPVWKAAHDLAVHRQQAVGRFGKTSCPPRYHKYTRGFELRQTGHFKTSFRQRALTAL